MCSDTPRLVAAALLFERGRLLICQRPTADVFPNQWEFPGGKIEPGEDPKAALRRELLEELGIVAEFGEEVWRTEHQYPDHPPVRLFFFAVRRYSGAVENRVFQQMSWVDVADLVRYDFLEADRPLVLSLASREVVLSDCEKSQE